MSKAFTREDDDAGFALPPAAARHSEARLTAYGARLVRERVAEQEAAGHDATRLRALVESALIVEPARADHVALGAQVTFRSRSAGASTVKRAAAAARGAERTVVIVTPDEVGVVPLAVSAASPLAQALLGAVAGDVVELELPRGAEELTISSIAWPS